MVQESFGERKGSKFMRLDIVLVFVHIIDYQGKFLFVIKEFEFAFWNIHRKY